MMSKDRAEVLKGRYKALANVDVEEIIKLAAVYKEKVPAYGENEFPPFVIGYMACREKEVTN
jgi:hypothetical protein